MKNHIFTLIACGLLTTPCVINATPTVPSPSLPRYLWSTDVPLGIFEHFYPPAGIGWQQIDGSPGWFFEGFDAPSIPVQPITRRFDSVPFPDDYRFVGTSLSEKHTQTPEPSVWLSISAGLLYFGFKRRPPRSV